METEEIVRELTETTARSKSNTKRLDEVEAEQKEMKSLVSAVEVIATKQETMNENLSEMKSDIKEMKEKPAKKWDNVVDKVIMTILGAVILYIMAKIGM